MCMWVNICSRGAIGFEALSYIHIYIYIYIVTRFFAAVGASFMAGNFKGGVSNLSDYMRRGFRIL